MPSNAHNIHPKVLLVVFDGCRPDALAEAHTPHVDTLWQTGAYTWSARTVMPSWSLPTHMSMFRSVTPEKHGVHDNVFQPTAAAFPSVIDVAHQARLKTALFYSWDELRDLAAYGSVDMSFFRNGYVTADIDQAVAEQAAMHMTAYQPDFAFVYLCESDLAGHDHGWMSRPYIESIERMDRALGNILAALSAAGLREQYTLLLLADHGGHELTHGTDCAEDMTIPWILNGPRVKPGCVIETPVCIIDTAATIAHILDLPRPAEWEGQPIVDALYE